MLTKGDKIVVVKEVAGGVIGEGEICEVESVSENGLISFTFGNGMHLGVMSEDEFEAHFEKYEESSVAPTVTDEMIDDILNNSEINVTTVFDKCTVVSCKLPNGFVIVESSACVSPENYDVDTGVAICMDRITDKIWELEGYKLQDELYHLDLCNECEDCGECLGCNCE